MAQEAQFAIGTRDPVTGVQDGIRLNITKRQAANLPPVDIDHSG